MLGRIFKAISFLVISLVLTSILPVIDVGASDSQLSKESNGDNPLQIVIVPSDQEKTTGSLGTEIYKNNKKDPYPDLGDEQVFPFVAGLGKNSGKN